MPVKCLCLMCHASFVVNPSKIPSGRGKYCSKRCADQAKSQFPLAVLIEQFWSRVAKTDTCWLWTGYTKDNGYGCLVVAKRLTYAHRLAYELTYGPMLPGLQCLHTCDTPACCRPDHLFAGTQSDNMRDMIAKRRNAAQTHPERVARGERHGSQTHPERMPRGERHGSRIHPERLPRGERHGQAKLTEADVRAMRRLRIDGHMPYLTLARAFGVSPSTVGRIINGKIWSHIA